VRFFPSCVCCGGTGNCFCCEGDDDRVAIDAEVTLISGSFPWDLEGSFTLSGPGGSSCAWNSGSIPLTPAGVAPCSWSITLFCTNTSSPFSGCSSYRLSVSGGPDGSGVVCFLTLLVEPDEDCSCSPLSLHFQFTLTMTVDPGSLCASFCGATPDVYIAKYEVILSEP
jgi:hypothetical protein